MPSKKRQATKAKEDSSTDSTMIEIGEALKALGDGPEIEPVIKMASRIGYSVGAQFDPDARIIYILEEITDELVRRFLPMFNVLDETDGEITVVFSSPGGSVSAGSVIYSALVNASNPIITFGLGSVASMAAVLLQAGDIRLLDENCRILVHGGSTGFEGGVEAMAAFATEARINVDWCRTVMAKRSGMSAEEVRKLTSRESFLSAKEAVKCGLADKVLPTRHKKTPDFFKKKTKKAPVKKVAKKKVAKKKVAKKKAA